MRLTIYSSHTQAHWGTSMKTGVYTAACQFEELLKNGYKVNSPPLCTLVGVYSPESKQVLKKNGGKT